MLGEYIDEMWSVKGLEDIAIEMLAQSMMEAIAKGQGFIIDGTPRTVEAAKKLVASLAERDQKLDCVIEFLFSAESAVKRLEGRRVDPKTGDVYHVDFKPPEDGGVDERVHAHRSDKHSFLIDLVLK